MITNSDIEALASTWDGVGRKPKQGKVSKGWTPDLNPTQQKIFDDPTRNILAYGEKGTGKSIGCGHKMVRHCYENTNAFQICIAPSIFTGKEGIWHDLDQFILPAWKKGFGLEYTESKLDPETKDRHRWIGNIHGEWSKIVLKSIPHASYVEARVKGPAPSGVYIDEITNCNGREYYTYPAAQLMRRRDVEGPMQFLASCNPEGPSNWVYQLFWDEVINKETGERDHDYAVYHVPISENLHRLPPGYIEHLTKVLKDPIQKRRLIDGEWVDMPTGQSIFKDHYVRDLVVRGDETRQTGILPVKGFPIEVGYDPGTTNFCISFKQLLFVGEKLIWIVFDELNFVGSHRTYKHVVARVLETMDYWNRKCDTVFKFNHIGDAAAFTTRRQDGSFDVQDIEKYSEKRIKMKPCPKGKESIVGRVRMVQGYLDDSALFVSAKCKHTIDMLTLLSSKRAKPGEYDPNLAMTPIRNRYIHQFDAMTYPMWFYHTKSRLPSRNEIVKPQIYTVGSDPR